MSSLPLRRPCPHSDCPAKSTKARARVVRHGRLTTRRGVRTRYLCRACRRTFVRTLGTPYHRLRRPRREFDQAVKLVVEGNTATAVARVSGVAPSTVLRWTERAARHARRFDEEHLKLEAPVELQIDELNTHGAGESDPDWVFGAIEVWSRVWLATRVSRRTLRATLLFARKMRQTLRTVPQPLLVTSDCFKYYPPVLKRILGPLCVYVQLDNHYRRDRIVSSSPRLVLGSPEQLERALERSEDSNKPNTAFIERLNLYLRRAISYLHRRTTGKVRRAARLENALEIVRLNYNFIRPHSSLRFGKVTRTPAMQAGLFDRPLSFREIFSWVPPPAVALPRPVEYR